MKRFLLCVCLFLLTAAVHAGPPEAIPGPRPPFFLHDGDRVVWYGDSITEQQMYARDVETFVLTRYPSLRVHFLNSGWSGDTVNGGGGGNIDLRLTRDVVNYKPTVVTIFLGMNDGGYNSYDQARFQAYAQGLTHIVERLQTELPGVRLCLLTPSFFDYAAKERDPSVRPYNYQNPAPDYNATLLRYGDFVKRLGAQRSIPVVDTNAPMASAIAEGRKTDPKFSLSGDGVHPNEVGHAIIAAAVLQAWHANADRNDIILHLGGNVQVGQSALFWPLPQAVFSEPSLPYSIDRFSTWRVLLPDETITPRTRYTLFVNDEKVQDVTAAQLQYGINEMEFSDLAHETQSQQVLSLVQKRIDIWHDFWKGKNGLAQKPDVPTNAELAQLRAKDD